VKGLRSVAFSLSAAAGAALGWALAQRYLARHREALFSPRRRRRHAALGYLAGRPTPDTVRVLRDYLSWERHPALRRRARRIVQDLERVLG
jgi:predicted component of type VI protein secretion system